MKSRDSERRRREEKGRKIVEDIPVGGGIDAPSREDHKRTAYLAADGYRMGVLLKGRSLPSGARDGESEEGCRRRAPWTATGAVLEGEAPMRWPLQLRGQHGFEQNPTCP